MPGDTEMWLVVVVRPDITSEADSPHSMLWIISCNRSFSIANESTYCKFLLENLEPSFPCLNDGLWSFVQCGISLSCRSSHSKRGRLWNSCHSATLINCATIWVQYDLGMLKCTWSFATIKLMKKGLMRELGYRRLWAPACPVLPLAVCSWCIFVSIMDHPFSLHTCMYSSVWYFLRWSCKVALLVFGGNVKLVEIGFVLCLSLECSLWDSNEFELLTHSISRWSRFGDDSCFLIRKNGWYHWWYINYCLESLDVSWECHQDWRW